MSIVLSPPYRSTRGRKPSRPAFLYRFHEASGTTVADAFGNGPSLVLDGSEGSIWTPRGAFNPPALNSTNRWRPGAADPLRDYPAQVLDFLTPGAAFIAWAYYYRTAGSTGYETILSLGRDGSSYGGVAFRTGTGGGNSFWMRGTGAGNGTNFAGNQASNNAWSTLVWHCAVTAAGLTVQSFLNANTQPEWVGLWTNNGNAIPASMALFAANGAGLCIGALGSSNTLANYSSHLRSTASGAAVHNVGAIKIDAPNVGLALDLAVEFGRYPRAVNEILAGL